MKTPHHSTEDPKPVRRLLSRAPRTRSVIAATGLLVICTAPFAAARTGDELREGVRNGTSTQETKIISRIASTTAPTGGYSTRQSNLSADGGGAIYGCRSKAGGSAAKPKPQNPCVRANNLSTGYAFEFNAAKGTIGGLFSVGAGGDGVKPFITNATGVATGLNADRLDNFDAAALIAASRVKTGLDADTVDGKDAAELGTRWALINEAGAIEQQTGGFTIVNCYSANANCYISAGSDVRNKGLHAQIAINNTDGSAILSGETGVAPCGATFVACAPPNTEDNNVIVVAPRESDGTVPGGVAPPPPAAAARFYVYVNGATGS
ncbi:MAG TPA: hypothetical protein VNB24_08690 [Acidimicrobiales bacterium]|nr:hypothetical protein [Acidimicrobiales bacterium]